MVVLLHGYTEDLGHLITYITPGKYELSKNIYLNLGQRKSSWYVEFDTQQFLPQPLKVSE